MPAGGGFDPAHTQRADAVRCEWGPTGAAALVGDLGPGDLAVVVDVLSFSTTVTVAVEGGASVWPFSWRDERAAAFAAERDAVLAVGRSEARAPGAPAEARVSLSPAEVALGTPPRVVLPSPNGATISAALADAGPEVVAGCLRNAGAVAARARGVLDAGGRVAVVACGERWPDGSLRPAQEDWWGAGAIVGALGPLSAEARAAGAAFEAVADDLPEALAACASGRELIAKGYGDDVAVAAALDASVVVPVLRAGAFTAG